MNSASSLVAWGMVLALGAGHALAAQQEEDSVYRYGRWAVLSPAAGGGEPYIAALTPDAANNLRPEEGFSPEILSINDIPGPPGPGTPPVVVPNPPGNPPPPGDPRTPPVVTPPIVVPNPPASPPPIGDPRGSVAPAPLVGGPPVAVPN